MLELLLLLFGWFALGFAACGIWFWFLLSRDRVGGVNEPGYLVSIRCKGCDERVPEFEAREGYCAHCWEVFAEGQDGA